MSKTPAVAEPWKPANLEEEIVYQRFLTLFDDWHRSQPPRTGVHVSSLIVADKAYCIRQIVLMQFFPHQDINVWGRTYQIFLQGWVIHQKWQDLLRKAGLSSTIVPLSIEDSRTKKGITFTPDAIIEMGKGRLLRKYIVEIKSMKSELYHAMKGIHKAARIQANMYMWLEGIDRAIVLVENKDTQEFKFWIIEYDQKLIQKYINRAIRTRTAIQAYRQNETLPMRHVMCENIHTAKAQRCPVRDACFAGRLERRKMLNGPVQSPKPNGSAGAETRAIYMDA